MKLSMAWMLKPKRCGTRQKIRHLLQHLTTMKKYQSLTGLVLRQKSEREDCHALAQSAEQKERQGLRCCGLGVYRLSRRFDCLAGSAFSRVSAEIDRTS
ncbi:hypothetical protein M2175_004265 [Bradyrhizobium elkanii]|uniref:hypothetical protein n=1 Tax=Bradyrhizobium TaxID=374 RepID=UPI0004AD82CB|nr:MULTISPECIES: hypothetical protein [Bradyrhizobium]MCS3929234.1 hypothetical protein [Bradyrhizobium elkanii]MCS3969790.1 hypothetical protein [Bradyrhizobium japonicum]